MKMGEQHYVPLATQAVVILKEIQLLTGKGRFVFPAIGNRERPLSENTLNAALRRLGYTGDQMTAHGFRSMASTQSRRWIRSITEDWAATCVLRCCLFSLCRANISGKSGSGLPNE